ncbi:YoaK family protein [Roseateles sp. BYS87W]|uniref:YoaK family protein n=1 Tax=Pelomonas baiyunensis TaxID=3299026 RepID=A0ABW7GUI3_9BURK
MPTDYARRLLSVERTADGNAHLGWWLAFVAGATNAGGFLAVRQYTSHMTGMVSAAADGLVLGEHQALITACGALLFFMTGAATTAVLVHLGRQRRAHSIFALPLLVEAASLVVFGLMGAWLAGLHALFVPATVSVLCFTMGLQNALITKVSRSEIRTTHVTGIVTDLGIEFGRGLCSLGGATEPLNAAKVRLLAGLLLAFAVGGVVGAWSFKAVGYAATLPLAGGLAFLGAVPALDDLRGLRGR